MSDADEGPGMVGEEAPLGHRTSIVKSFQKSIASFLELE
jgi:hypothetical protein